MPEGAPMGGIDGSRSSWAVRRERIQSDSAPNNSPILDSDNSALLHDGDLSTEERVTNLREYADNLYGGGIGMLPGDAGHSGAHHEIPGKQKRFGGAGV